MKPKIARRWLNRNKHRLIVKGVCDGNFKILCKKDFAKADQRMIKNCLEEVIND